MASAASNDSMGCVLILSNPCGEEGTNLHEQYARRMEQLWTEKLGCELFENMVHSDLTAEAVMEVFGRLANNDASSYQYLIVVVICNGGLLPTDDGIWHHFIEANDGNYVREEAFFSKFYNNNRAWREKPKLFILGYNRIAEMQPRMCDDGSGKQIQWEPEEKYSLSDGNNADNTCPKFSNLLVLYGSATDLMEEVYNAFSTRYTTDTFTQMLTRVNGEMKKKGKWSVFESTITSPCTLFPPRHQDTIRDAGDNSLCFLNDNVNRMREIFSKTVRLGRSGAEENLREMVENVLLNMPQDITVAEVRKTLKQSQISRNVSKTPLKGRGVLICNCLGEGGNAREAHITDKNKMESLWNDTLRCDMKTYLNKTAFEMKEIIRNLSLSDSEEYDYLLVVVSSHGGLKKLDSGDVLRPVCFGVNDQPVCEREILTYFNENSPWHDKVKLFILDYCRGKNNVLRVPKAGTSYPDMNYLYDEKVFNPGTLPVINNCVVLYATYCNYLAYANDLIPTVADVFAENWDNKSVTEMLVMVNASMRNVEHPNEKKAMSVFKSTLGAEFHLYQEDEIETDSL